MNDYRLTKDLLARALAAKTGNEPADTVEFVGALLEVALAHGLITARRLEQAERDAHIYDLMGSVSAPMIAQRMGMARETVHRCAKAHLVRIRKAG